MSSDHSTGLLLGFQLELAFALVGRTSLDPLPLADELLTELCGERVRELDVGDMHVANRGPRHALFLASRERLQGIAHAREALTTGLATLSESCARVEGRLLPTGMHPWLSPERAQPWPHGGDHRDKALIKMAGQARHGWANHNRLRLSLPFADDKSFREIFACLRFASPLLPALAASSPFFEGRRGPAMNCRLAARRDFLDGAEMVPRAYQSRAAYQAEFLRPSQERIAGLDPRLRPEDVSGHLLHADFAAGLIHIDAFDVQECLDADLALCAFTAACTGWLMHQTGTARQPWPAARISELLDKSVLGAEHAVIRDRSYLELFHFPERGACRFDELLQYLIEEALVDDPAIQTCADTLRIMARASLATRMLRTLQASDEPFTWEELFNLYRKLVACSEENAVYLG